MKKDCSTCAHRSTDCAQGLMTLPLKDLLVWCREAKKKAGVTNVKLTELTDIPLGTMERIMAGKIEDAKFSTIQPLVVTLLGLLPEGFNCPDDPTQGAAEREQLKQRLAELEHVAEEKERLELRIEKMQADHAAELAAARADAQSRVDYLKEVVAARDATIQEKEHRSTWLLRALLVLGALVITVLTIDCLNPNIGFVRY